MKIIKDERAENPIEVGFYVLIVILVMAFLMLAVGAFLDAFEVEIGNISIPLSSWGTGVLATYMNYVNYAYFVPSIFIIIVMIWGVRAVIRKHTYTAAQDQKYLNYDEF